MKYAKIIKLDQSDAKYFFLDLMAFVKGKVIKGSSL